MPTKPKPTRPSSFYHENVYSLSGSDLNDRVKSKMRGNDKDGIVDGRKLSVREIVAEMLREPGATMHLDAPQPAQHLYGLAPNELVARVDELEELIKPRRESYVTDGVTHTRRQRRSIPVALVAVASYPGPYNPDDAEQARWRDLVLDGVKGRYEDRLRAAYAHVDEPHYHIHFFADTDGAPAKEELHCGHEAALKAERAGMTKKEQQDAYNEAMVELQDGFYLAVGVPMGWARKSESPQPRRPRTQALAEKAKQLQEQEEQQATREKALAAREAEANTTRERHRAREAALVAREATAQQLQAAMAEREAKLRQRERELDQERSELAMREQLREAEHNSAMSAARELARMYREEGLALLGRIKRLLEALGGEAERRAEHDGLLSRLMNLGRSKSPGLSN